ncbi:hypothetical protein HYDPIDRAFT_111472 [Hydnomerulius pinastri MD-312]|uniref:Uncharacterized protein n=1 Tax=Hydnomerulius pinastri MD-312 TaxID=994086 RepID=A0A0C9WA97_9AGAM|nr:hypothetical protein HYDPIDRAFT_111472 [Hydnomerulius pinastri MD-312]
MEFDEEYASTELEEVDMLADAGMVGREEILGVSKRLKRGRRKSGGGNQRRSGEQWLQYMHSAHLVSFSWASERPRARTANGSDFVTQLSLYKESRGSHIHTSPSSYAQQLRAFILTVCHCGIPNSLSTSYRLLMPGYRGLIGILKCSYYSNPAFFGLNVLPQPYRMRTVINTPFKLLQKCALGYFPLHCWSASLACRSQPCFTTVVGVVCSSKQRGKADVAH